MRTNALANLALTICALASVSTACAQNGVLAQLYGQGVHAYNSGNYTEARKYLTMAIDNGSDDPRAYYFLGMVAYASGNTYEAEADWQQGARLEAQGRTNPFVGRSLIRFQGAGRLKLETIREQAQLQAMAARAARSSQGMDEPGARPAPSTAVPPTPPSAVVPNSAPPNVAVPAAPATEDDPFGGDLAEGDAKVTKEDALEGAMEDPFADEPAPADASADSDTPAAEGTDPFGAEAPGDAMQDDPFGDAGAGDDPFAN